MNPFVQSLLLSDQTTGSDSGFSIDQSVRFSGTQRLTRTFANNSGGTYTWSAWIKRADLGTGDQQIFGTVSPLQFHHIRSNNFGWTQSSVTSNETAVRRDPSAWYHRVDTSDGTNIRMYINGELVLTWNQASTGVNTNVEHFIGGDSGRASEFFKGYMANIIFIDGTRVTDTDGVIDEFGEYNSDGVWVPKEYEGTYGNNGFHLDFADNSAPGNDVSGNNNDWTASNFDTADVVLYTPFEAGSGTTYESNTANRTASLINPGSAFDGNTAGGTQVNEAGGGFWYLTYTINNVSGLRILMTGQTSEIAETRVNGSVATTSVSGSYIVISSPPSTVTEVAIRRNTANTQVYQVEVDTGSGFTALLDNPNNDVDFLDTPTSNYATYNPLINNDPPTLAAANLDATAVNNGLVWATQKLPNEHLYAEFIRDGDGDRFAAGVGNADGSTGFHKGAASDNDYAFMIVYSEWGGNNSIFNENTTATQTSLTAYNTGDVLGVEWRGDLATRQVNFYINGTQVGNSENVADGDDYYFAVQRAGGTNPPEVLANFGQMPFLAAPSGVTNTANGMQTNNLTQPTIKKGTDHFEAKLYDGTGVANTITGMDFAPDLIWIKGITTTDNHVLVDTIRGTNSVLFANSNDQAAGSLGRFTSFNNDGFEVDTTDGSWNQNTQNYVGWCWKAGGAPTATNTEAAGNAQTAGSVKVDGANGSFAQGTIGINSMTVNTTAGFSIVQYTGTGAVGTFPHGLGATPEWAIFKCINQNTTDWDCYHVGIGNSRVLKLDQDVVQSAEGVAYYNRTSPTDTLFTLGAGGENNTLNEEMIAYLWAPKPGYSKFGRYTGNDNVNGNVIDLGFRPSYVMIKGITQGWPWMIWDTSRNTSNPSTQILKANETQNQSDASSTAVIIDILSNGFKLRNAGQMNQAADYAYIAFAEHPFGGENTPPANAR